MIFGITAQKNENVGKVRYQDCVYAAAQTFDGRESECNKKKQSVLQREKHEAVPDPAKRHAVDRDSTVDLFPWLARTPERKYNHLVSLVSQLLRLIFEAEIPGIIGLTNEQHSPASGLVRF
jgi:hypothetical protein